jgi:hypothetical protein
MQLREINFPSFILVMKDSRENILKNPIHLYAICVL